MSSNPFAALDDSDDEGPPKAKAPKKSNAQKVVPASKPDPKSKPKNNDRNTKHGRGGRPPVRDGKRAYDRRSGTGRGKEIKKGGGGARNWGNEKAEAKKAEGRINENEEVAPATDGNESPDVPSEEVEPEKEDNTMTYADYMASKGKKEEVALREVKNDFAGMAACAKGEEESFLEMGGGKKKKERKKKEVDKKTVDVGFRVAKANSDGGRGDRRDGRGRGAGRGDRRDGRGRGRGGKGGRGAGRGAKAGGNKKPQGLNVQDEGAFPSL
ncbi:unnamed protein product [Pseudo-nitzschia multistriata]|uniref:Hyaluronan/mRNA-binding protein domain-containing protein n=1 Tax=Pseudo-nitzschia multistriata TaxID=183589 RepID=A0A448ZAD0_9STRA|nr:unnamed protein product [Pseudo-nitzschia multistriata]